MVLAVEGILALFHSSAVAASAPQRKCLFRVSHPALTCLVLGTGKLAPTGGRKGFARWIPVEGSILLCVFVAGERWALCWSLAEAKLLLGCLGSRASPRNVHIPRVWDRRGSPSLLVEE